MTTQEGSRGGRLEGTQILKTVLRHWLYRLGKDLVRRPTGTDGPQTRRPNIIKLQGSNRGLKAFRQENVEGLPVLEGAQKHPCQALWSNYFEPRSSYEVKLSKFRQSKVKFICAVLGNVYTPKPLGERRGGG